MELLPFGEQSLRHFIYLERPEGLDMADQDELAAIEKAAPLPVANEDDIAPRLQDFDTIGELYRAIEVGFDRLADRLGEARLFLGPPGAQARRLGSGSRGSFRSPISPPRMPRST
jgi:hypothetical protein